MKSLSDKLMVNFNEDGTKIEYDFFHTKDVKEAIKELKGTLEANFGKHSDEMMGIEEQIERIFGEKLT